MFQGFVLVHGFRRGGVTSPLPFFLFRISLIQTQGVSLRSISRLGEVHGLRAAGVGVNIL